MVVFSLLSSAFDLLTFAILLLVFEADAPLFQTGWFIGSTLTELAVLLVLRTRRLAFRSRPSTGLLITGGYIVAAEATKRVFYRRATASATSRTRPVPAVPRRHRRLEHLAREHGHRRTARATNHLARRGMRPFTFLSR